MDFEQQSSEVDRDILYVVAIFRVVYCGLVTLVIMSLIGHYSGSGVAPPIEETLFTYDLVIWLITFLVTLLITFVVGFKIWFYLSWFTGTVLYKPLRDKIVK